LIAQSRLPVVFVDLDRCVECYACEVACKQEHSLAIGPRLIRVVKLERLVNGRVERVSAPMACSHCSDAPCIDACPSKALRRVEETGAVIVIQERCIGCRMCLVACPFGAPQYEAKGKMVKCDLCSERLARKEKPACVSACPVEALKFETAERISAVVRGKRLSQAWSVKGSQQR
jgi:Fe-S-cluster-containing dehydrogenase component